MDGGEIACAETPHADRAEQQRIFHPRANAPQPFAKEPPEELLLLRIRRWHEQAAKQCVDVIAPKRARDFRIVGNGHHCRVERAP